MFRDVTKLFEICRSKEEPVGAVVDCSFQKISADTSWLSQLTEGREKFALLQHWGHVYETFS